MTSHQRTSLSGFLVCLTASWHATEDWAKLLLLVLWVGYWIMFITAKAPGEK